MIAGTGLIAAAKDNLPRIGMTPGLTCNFAEVEIDTETGMVEDQGMHERGRLSAPCCFRWVWATRSPAARSWASAWRIWNAISTIPSWAFPPRWVFHQGKVPTYLDVPPKIGWGRSEKPDPQHPMGIKGVGEPSQGSGAAASPRRSPMRWAAICSTARRLPRT